MSTNEALQAQIAYVRNYANCIKKNLCVWEKFLATQKFDWITESDIHVWIVRLKATITALEYHYACDGSERWEMTQVGSGFPRPYDIRLLEHDFVRRSEEVSSAVIPAKEIKRMFVDVIFQKASMNYALLDRFGKSCALEHVQKYGMMNIFRIVSIRELESINGSRAYVCCWERYTNQSVPVLYGMLFEYHSSDALNEEMRAELSLVLREETSNMPSLSGLAKQIDRAVAPVRPKWVGRIIVGPIFISHLTQDEIELQQIIDHVADDEDLVSASRVVYEYIVSEGEDDARGLCDPQGRRQFVLQQFNPRYTDDECLSRGATSVQKWLYTSHAVAQLMSDQYRQEINHEIIGGEYAECNQ